MQVYNNPKLQGEFEKICPGISRKDKSFEATQLRSERKKKWEIATENLPLGCDSWSRAMWRKHVEERLDLPSSQEISASRVFEEAVSLSPENMLPLLKEIEKLLSAPKDINQELSLIDLHIGDLLHILELENLNAVQIMLLTKKLREALRKRRKIKDAFTYKQKLDIALTSSCFETVIEKCVKITKGFTQRTYKIRLKNMLGDIGDWDLKKCHR